MGKGGARISRSRYRAIHPDWRPRSEWHHSPLSDPDPLFSATVSYPGVSVPSRIKENSCIPVADFPATSASRRASNMIPGQIAHDGNGKPIQVLQSSPHLVLRSISDGEVFYSRDVALSSHELSFPPLSAEALAGWAREKEVGDTALEALCHLRDNFLWDEEVSDWGRMWSRIGNWVLERWSDGWSEAVEYRTPLVARDYVLLPRQKNSAAMQRMEEWLDGPGESGLRSFIAGSGPRSEAVRELQEKGVSWPDLPLSLPPRRKRGASDVLAPLWIRAEEI